MRMITELWESKPGNLPAQSVATEHEGPPEELKKLGCSDLEYFQELLWLKELGTQTITTVPMFSPVYGKGSAYRVLRQYTRDEWRRLLSAIKRKHLLVETVSVGMMRGVAYNLYTNPQADRLAKGMAVRGSRESMKPAFLSMFHWECVDLRYLPNCPKEPPIDDDAVEFVFQFMSKFSHSENNLAWLEYEGLASPPNLSSCTY